MKFWVDNIYKSFEVFFLEKKTKNRTTEWEAWSDAGGKRENYFEMLELPVIRKKLDTDFYLNQIIKSTDNPRTSY